MDFNCPTPHGLGRLKGVRIEVDFVRDLRGSEIVGGAGGGVGFVTGVVGVVCLGGFLGAFRSDCRRESIKMLRCFVNNTSLVVKGCSLTACNAAPPAKSKLAARGPQNGRGGLERCLPLGF